MSAPRLAVRLPRIQGAVEPTMKAYLDRLATTVEQSITDLGRNMTAPGTPVVFASTVTLQALLTSPSYANDAAAAAAGVSLGALYRNGSVVQFRTV